MIRNRDQYFSLIENMRYKYWPWIILKATIPSLIYFIIIIVIVMPCILAWINTIKKKENIPSVFVFDGGEILFCCNSSLRKYSIHWVNVYCNVILPPQLTCSIQMSIHFNSWKEQKTLLKYVNIYNMEGESNFFFSWEKGSYVDFFLSHIDDCDVFLLLSFIVANCVIGGSEKKR